MLSTLSLLSLPDFTPFITSLTTITWVDQIAYAVFVGGLIGLLATFFMKFIPFVYVYRSFIQTISIILLVASSFAIGWSYDNKIWTARAAELQAKLEIAEQKSKQENVRIVTKVVTKTQVIKQRGEDIVKIVERDITKHDDACKLPKEFVIIHNQAAEAPK